VNSEERGPDDTWPDPKIGIKAQAPNTLFLFRAPDDAVWLDSEELDEITSPPP